MLINDLKAYQSALSELAILAVTDTKGTIIEVNRKFEEISQYSREELLGQSHRIINSGHHDKKFFVDMWKTISSGNVWRGEVKNKNKSGRFYWVDTAIAPVFDSNQKVAKYLAVRFEITDKKSNEEELINRQNELDKLNNFKNLMISLISHDLKSPVASLTGLVDLFNHGHLSREEVEGSFKKLSVKLEEVSMLLDTLMNWAYSHYDDLSLIKEPICCEPVIKEVVDDFRRRARAKKISLETNIEKQCTEIFMDKHLLKVVLRNLLDNAIKFTDEEGKVKVLVEEMGDMLNIFVIDTGRGMDDETINKVLSFNKFTTRGTKGEGGSGIGMFVCKDFVEKLNGKLTIKSKPGEGTEVKIEVPLNLHPKTK